MSEEAELETFLTADSSYQGLYWGEFFMEIFRVKKMFDF